MTPPEENGKTSLPARASSAETEDRGRPARREEPPDRETQDDETTGSKPRQPQAGHDGEGKEKQEDGQSPEKKEEPKKPFWKRPVLLSVMIGVVLLIGVGALIWWLMTRDYETTDDAFIDGHIVHVAPRVAGRVSSLNVDDNQYVEANTVVVNIDPAPFAAAYANAKAGLLQSRAKVAQAQADLLVQRATADQAHADVAVAEANEADAARDYARYLAVPSGARTQQQLDTAETRKKSTAAQLIEAQKKAASADAMVKSSETAIDAARAQVEAGEAQLQQSGLDVEYTKVTAGQAGYVTRRTVEAGNYVQTGQELLTIVPKSVWVTANFKETQLRYMKPNQPVEVSIDAYPQRKYRAHVDSIQAGTGAVFSTLPPENATGNFVKIVQRVPVKIVFDEWPEHVLAPGESVYPHVDISSGR